MHANSLQVTPMGVLLLSARYLDTLIAISPQLDRIAWRIGRFKSDFTFPNPSDRFYHEHYVRMLENGNLLLFDNGNGRPAAEGGLYTRALELALDWKSMTAAKVWEYRHQTGTSGGTPVYKYSDRVGTAQRLPNGNTIVWFGADIDPTTLKPKTPQTYTLVEADANPEAGALAVLDVQIPPGTAFPYRALPVETLFGEVPAPMNMVAIQPAILPYSETNAPNQGAVENGNAGYAVADPSHPAVAGKTIVIFCEGLGQVTNPPPAGVSSSGLNSTVVTPTVFIDGIQAPAPGYSGLAPGWHDLYQVNVVVPPGIHSGHINVYLQMKDPITGQIIQSNTITIN
jgi:uncharacterized protein (TIGR03437 family)